MGWADALMTLGIPYDSEEALKLADDVMAFMSYHSKRESVDLAKTRGRFEYFDKSVYTHGNWFSAKYAGMENHRILLSQWQALDEEIAAYGLRHATTICLAPTGTISIIAGASGGIEPLYALVFKRNVLEGTEMLEVNPLFEATLKARGLYSEALMDEVVSKQGVRGMAQIPEDLQQVFVTAHEVTPYWHVAMQAAFQRHSDNAVSKTINFPESASSEQIEETYQLAYQMGLKGITVYRNNSRQFQPMSHTAMDSRHCPDCHKPLLKIEGCYQCPDCQYAYCG
jgi:ribonucleoside-diphosphate reductase alpha chain